MHICGPASSYSYSESRTYTPPDSLLADYLYLAQVLKIERVVFIQPSIYGENNAAMLKAMAECPLTNRGVAVLNIDATDTQIESLHDLGVRGIRFNLVDVINPEAELPLDTIKKLAKRIAPLDWHIELLLHVDDFPHLDDDLSELPVDIVVGHLGYFRPEKTPEDPGFQALVRLMKTNRCWTKLTGPYRLSSEPFPYENVDQFATYLIEEAAEQLLWGSDWPHVCVKTPMPNDGDLLDLLSTWTSDSKIRHKILVENPARLYDF
jgi:predicted TIM-barrel fold metal-dependent hydrolase